MKPEGKLVVCYGGGVNSVAVLVQLKRLGLKPTAIVMADPGSERGGTIRFRDNVLPKWLKTNGFPTVETITRIEMGQGRPRAWRLESLFDECFRLKALPSVAYGWKKCSAKYKGDTQRWWSEKQEWMRKEWVEGRRVVKTIGYDYDEERRVKKAAQNEWEDARFVPWYPLFEAKLDREACEDLIRSEGLPVPPKSSCTFCPNMTLTEWQELRRDEPEKFAEAVRLSRNAEVTSPDVVGLMRCNPHGQRQLHEWVDGKYDVKPDDACDPTDEQPCECAL